MTEPTDEELKITIVKAYRRRALYNAGFAAGRASRDAEVAELKAELETAYRCIAKHIHPDALLEMDRVRETNEALCGQITVISEERSQAWGEYHALKAENERLRKQVVELKGELATAQANYRFMVERAADEKLGGYRELGQRAADAEDEADRLREQVADLEAELEAALERTRRSTWEMR